MKIKYVINYMSEFGKEKNPLETPGVEVAPSREEKGSGLEVNPEGRIVTKEEAEERRKKGLEEEGWREQQ